MSITLQTIVEDGLGTVAKIIKIDTAEDYEVFKAFIQDGVRLLPETDKDIKGLADRMKSSGKIMQVYDQQKLRDSK